MPHRGAAPQAANQEAILLEWEVYSPTPVNPAFYKLGLQPLTHEPFFLITLRNYFRIERFPAEMTLKKDDST